MHEIHVKADENINHWFTKFLDYLSYRIDNISASNCCTKALRYVKNIYRKDIIFLAWWLTVLIEK